MKFRNAYASNTRKTPTPAGCARLGRSYRLRSNDTCESNFRRALLRRSTRRISISSSPGCGTGQTAIASAQKFLGAHVLAIDLSLTSLSYAKRRTPDDVAPRIEYAQADILKLASLERRFDVIDTSGVLHHMADPFEAWQILLTLLDAAV